MRLALLQPVYKYMCTTAYVANMNFLHELHKSGVTAYPIISTRTYISEARSQLVRAVVNNIENIDLVLWIDNDHQFNPIDFQNLYNTLQIHKLDVVSARYLIRSDERDSLCALVESRDHPGQYHRITEEARNLMKVDVIGLGFCLMKPQVLKHMWDKYKTDLFHTECVNKETLQYKGEDTTFCELLRAEGYEIYLDNSVNVGHYGFNLFPKLVHL